MAAGGIPGFFRNPLFQLLAGYNRGLPFQAGGTQTRQKPFQLLPGSELNKGGAANRYNLSWREIGYLMEQSSDVDQSVNSLSPKLRRELLLFAWQNNIVSRGGMPDPISAYPAFIVEKAKQQRIVIAGRVTTLYQQVKDMSRGRTSREVALEALNKRNPPQLRSLLWAVAQAKRKAVKLFNDVVKKALNREPDPDTARFAREAQESAEKANQPLAMYDESGDYES